MKNMMKYASKNIWYLLLQYDAITLYYITARFSKILILVNITFRIEIHITI